VLAGLLVLNKIAQKKLVKHAQFRPQESKDGACEKYGRAALDYLERQISPID
jgi:hypothetical protein